MGFNLDSWKAQIADYFKSHAPLIKQAGANTLYGLLAAGALLPAIGAYHGGEIAPVVIALSDLLGSVGSNLIANLIQKWKDKPNAEITQEVLGTIQKNVELRQAVDILLEKLEVVSSAQQALSDADKQWFVETLQAELKKVGSGIIINTEGGAVIVGDVNQGPGSTFVGRDQINAETYIAKQNNYHLNGATLNIGEPSVEMSPEMRAMALVSYLEYVIANNRYLELQGIRSGGKLVNIELDKIYIRLRTTQQRSIRTEQKWLAEEMVRAPGEKHRQSILEHASDVKMVIVSLEQALEKHRHLIVLGDPGSGKTTLLRYLALLYARDLLEGNKAVKEKIKLEESGYLPILLPLRKIGQFLDSRHTKPDGTEGGILLLEFLLEFIKGQHVNLPSNFFDNYLKKGQAIILLDGMDEVADPTLRGRVARLVESLTLAYPACRFIVTSRIVGYTGAARLGGDYVTTTVRDFNLNDIRQFLNRWNLLVAISQLDSRQNAEVAAAIQTEQLLASIQSNERVRELAINPLMLTVIALVHRDRVKLPDRRAELYAEAVAVLLGKLDEARGVNEIPVLDDQSFNIRERGDLLQKIAFYMHTQNKKELHISELRKLLITYFRDRTPNDAKAKIASERFISLIEERTGLLAARGEGVYSFSHLTFQEYLTALEVCGHDNYISTLLKYSGSVWWREVILLAAGSLSQERVVKLVTALAKKKIEPRPYHNLALALECLRDSGIVHEELKNSINRRLYRKFNAPLPISVLLLDETQRLNYKFFRRAEIIQTLSRAGAGYWSGLYGEPEWVTIPAGEFWMGGGTAAEPFHRVYLPEYLIARVPVTNYQYSLFLKATGHRWPDGWEDYRSPRGRDSHPVVCITWQDAISYCDWLSQMLNKQILLPSEAEWEKVARGNHDQRMYPWGNTFEEERCNTQELGLSDTTPVGVFPEGVSPYGALDLIGNVWEWTRSLWGKNIGKAEFAYPYTEHLTERENLQADLSVRRILRGGSWNNDKSDAQCWRRGHEPLSRNDIIGFRILLRISG